MLRDDCLQNHSYVAPYVLHALTTRRDPELFKLLDQLMAVSML